jgi:hypothetical protein
MKTELELLYPIFQGFPKIPRFNRDIIITEKIDGTNAQILIRKDGQVIPGSRKRYLTIENDNHSFAAWVAEHKQELRQLGSGRHFGEWWGQGINRGYGLDHKRFSLFNVSRWRSHGTSMVSDFRVKTKIEVPSCCHVVPILRIGRLSTSSCIIENALVALRERGSHAAPGFMQPEGIVIYHTAGNYLFKVTLENDKEPKGKDNG